MTTNLGTLHLFGANNKLVGSQICSKEDAELFEEGLANKYCADRFENAPNDYLLKEAKKQFRAYFQGKLIAFDIPIPAFEDTFTGHVLKFVHTIPYGVTVSYKDVAFGLNSGAVRAVGTAISKCLLSIVIPCHRVITSDGKLGGYGRGKEGLATKLALLNLEGVNL